VQDRNGLLKLPIILRVLVVAAGIALVAWALIMQSHGFQGPQ
jgi:hypothetical protein